jgi:site-specific recombinase XerD
MIGARPLNRVEQKAALANCKDSREKSLLALGFATGFRISELLSLTIDDVVDAKNRMVSYLSVKARNTKTKTGRTVRLNSSAAKAALNHALSMLRAGRKRTDRLFTGQKSARGEAITRQHAARLLAALFERADIAGAVSTHSMRKTFAQAVYAAFGGAVEKVQAALGHASISSTIAYLSFNHAEIDDALMALEI